MLQVQTLRGIKLFFITRISRSCSIRQKVVRDDLSDVIYRALLMNETRCTSNVRTYQCLFTPTEVGCAVGVKLTGMF